jgi:hypothetical protein
MGFFLLAASAVYAIDECFECHEKKTPGIVDYWKDSLHYAEKVSCKDCHGEDVEANHSRKVTVEAETCGSCHKAAYNSHRLSKHAVSLKTGRGCTRNMPESEERSSSCDICHRPDTAEPMVNVECAMFLAQSPEMQRQGCDTCHRVETGCDTCHTKHGTDLSLARSAEACGICHMGPDHAQYEMWRSSPHGVIFSERGEGDAPTCVTCHMVGGSHNVSRGIATGRSEQNRERERVFMVAICSRCHTGELARRNLDDADNIEVQSRALLAEAQKVIEELAKKGLLVPSPSERPEHPIFGHEFVIGPHMLYENLSHVEALYFRMMMFYYMSAFKGAFHQNPDYAHWFGNAPLKLTLSEIKSEAALLKDIKILKKRLELFEKQGVKDDLKLRLLELEEMRIKGKMEEEEFKKRKDSLLEEHGL